jgi:hypothetical protein
VGDKVNTHGANRQDKVFASREVGELQLVPDLHPPLANKVSWGPEHGPHRVFHEPEVVVHLHLEWPVLVQGEDDGLDPVHQHSAVVAAWHNEPVACGVAGHLEYNNKVSVKFTKSGTDFCLILFSYLLRDLDLATSHQAVHTILGD